MDYFKIHSDLCLFVVLKRKYIYKILFNNNTQMGIKYFTFWLLFGLKISFFSSKLDLV